MDKYLVKVKDKNSKIMANDFDQESLLLKLGKFSPIWLFLLINFLKLFLPIPFSTTTTTFNKWDAGDPNNGRPLHNEDCALIKSNGKRNDYPCKDRFNYICKRTPRE